MFRIRNLQIDTFNERVVFIHEQAVLTGNLGFKPLDRVRLVGRDPVSGRPREISGILNFCRNRLIEPDEIGLSDVAFRDLALPVGAEVRATLAPSPATVDRVRDKLRGGRLDRADFDAILSDVVAHRYSKVELSMFVLACSLRRLDTQELIDLARAMIGCGSSLDFGTTPIADKHCIGGIPGNRTTLVVVPIVASLGVAIPKTSSRAITSPAGTADTMGALAEIRLSPERMYEVVSKAGGCIAWGGALGLAPADDILITVERPMGIDTEAQMVASILAKKKTAGATHQAVDLEVEVVPTETRGPIGRGIGPRLEALDVLSVLRRDPDAPVDLREKSLYLAARILEMVGAAPPTEGYRLAQETLDSGGAASKLEEIIDAQGRRALPPEAPHRCVVPAPVDGRIGAIDCWGMAKIAKLAGAPANASAGIWILRTLGDVVRRGEPLFEIHAQTETQLQFALEYAETHRDVYSFGYG
jgi:thymidine phosphorylase